MVLRVVAAIFPLAEAFGYALSVIRRLVVSVVRAFRSVLTEVFKNGDLGALRYFMSHLVRLNSPQCTVLCHRP